MVAGIAVGLDSSEDECIGVKRWSARQKFMESDDEAAEVCNSNLKACKPLDNDGEPDTETSGDDLGSDCRLVVEGTLLGDVSICKKKKKKKKWKILSDSDCSFDEETSNTQLTLTKGEDEVKHSSQSHFSLMKESDLYDAEGSEDEVAPKHTSSDLYDADGSEDEVAPKHTSSDLYDAEGSEDEVAPKHISKPKVTSLSERKSKSKAVQQIHSETQRMVRESRVSLPYHKPRQRSLAEFLQRHHAAVPSVSSLKMSKNDLGELWKELAQREKDAEQFYKSDSDNDCSRDAVAECSVHGAVGSVDVASQVTTGVCSNDTAPSDKCSSNAVAPSLPNICCSDISTADTSGGSAAGVSAGNHDVTSSVSSSGADILPRCIRETGVGIGAGGNLSSRQVAVSNHEATECAEETGAAVTVAKGVAGRQVAVSNHEATECAEETGAAVTVAKGVAGRQVAVSNHEATECAEETGAAVTVAKGVAGRQVAVSNHEATECAEETGAAVSVAKGVAGRQVAVSNHEATECAEESGAAVSVANNVTSRQAADSDHDETSIQSLMAGDSCDFRLHYSESQSVDVGASEVVTCSALHDDKSSALDICLEVANTEDFALHYTETQNSEHSLPDDEELQKQEKTTCRENLQVSSADDNIAEAVLPSLVQRSHPAQADIMSLKPRLSAAPNGIVELDREELGPAGVLKLMQRFMKHSAVKQPQEKKHAIEVRVVSAEKDADGIEEVHRDTVKVTVGAEEPQHDPEMAKPGARLQRLKEELQQQIAQRRSEEWSRRLQEQRLDNEEEEQLSECGGLLDELEAETTDAETDSEEEESEEEEDIVLVEKKMVRSAFLDDEAAVSDDGEVSDDEDETVEGMSHGESQAAGVMVKSTFEEDEADVSDDGEGSDDKDETVEDMSRGESQAVGATVKSTFEKDEVDVSANDSEQSNTSPVSEQGIPDNSTVQKIDGTLASTQQLSGTLASTQQLSGTLASTQQLSGDLAVTPTASSRKSKLERAKTFDLFAATQEDGGDSDLEMIPPYQPPGAARKHFTPTEDRRRHILDFISPISNLTSLRDSPSTQSQLSSPLTGQMCSGTPAGVPKKLFTEPEPSNPQDNMDELLGLCSGQFTGNIGRLVDPVIETSHAGLEAELLGLCSGKFTSQPVNLHSLEQDEGWSVPTEDPPGRGVVLFSMDDEEDEVVQTRTHKKHKKLDFSDEELDLENDESSELSDVSETKFVDYDSEENELVGPSERRELAVSEFFEDEAELSESDWDSADEDEKGLDTLEFEEGDAEKLDQQKVKEQLDRIYMRHLLDNDRREVRMLQEILLEDGELHSEGGGRERKFRWKNINNVDDSELPHHKSDSEGADDAENEDEEMWRRMRHERDMVLQQQKVDDTLGDKSDSQLLKLGWAALKRTNSEDSTKRLPSIKRTVSDPLASPDPKCPFNLVAQRGSFLARGQNALARIAELTRGSTGGPVVGPKNSRNFVFATLSPEKVEDCNTGTTSVQTKKRKQDLGVTPPIVKRLRISDQHSRGRRLLDLLS